MSAPREHNLKIGVSGIRGVVGEFLTPALAAAFAQAFGTYVGAGRVVVGRDTRPSGESFLYSVIGAVTASGRDAIVLDIATTPTTEMVTAKTSAVAGIIVTASHNPAEFNGIKSRTRTRPLFGAELQEIAAIAAAGRFTDGNGRRQDHPILDEYMAYIQGDVRLARPLHVAVDCGNGTAGTVAPQLLERLGCRIEPLYCEPDGRFPHHVADPLVALALGESAQLVDDRVRRPVVEGRLHQLRARCWGSRPGRATGRSRSVPRPHRRPCRPVCRRARCR